MNLYTLKLDDLICWNEDSYVPSLYFEVIQFNGGEQHIKIKLPYNITFTDRVYIEISLTNSNKIMQLLLVTDALKRLGFKNIILFAPYLPYARQDRVCVKGEALSVKVMCDLINSQNYSEVYTLDNHSEVSTALLNNYKEIKTSMPFDMKNTVIISPDAGALKRCGKWANLIGCELIECSKKRDVTNGKILETIVHYDDLSKFDRAVIIDDICDGGRTFIELAKVLKLKNTKIIDLWVSHGIFSQGLDIFKGLIDNIYTTRSFKNEYTDKLAEKFIANQIF